MNFVSKHKKTFLSLLLFVLLQVSFLTFYIPQVKGAFEDSIFWQYGAEGGIIGSEPEPPFDWLQTTSPSYIKISDSQVHGVNRSLDFYMMPNPSEDDERRVRAWKNQDNFDTRHREFYASSWHYFPDEAPWNGEGTMRWNNFFNVRLGFGPSNNKWRYHWSARFRTVDGSTEIKFWHEWHDYPTANGKFFKNSTGYYTDNQLKGTWAQFQIYVKITSGSDSVIKAWINNDLVFSKTTWTTQGITCLAPEAYDEWDSKAGYWCGQTHDGYPCIYLGMYSGTGSQPSKTLFVDDIVMATQKVPSTYIVGGVSPGPGGWEDWANGFEEGDFSEWQNIDSANGGSNPTITSAVKYHGTYAANMTTDGSASSYSRAYKNVTAGDEVYVRTYVQFSALPDGDGEWMNFLRLRDGSAVSICYAGILNTGGSYYWRTRVSDDGGTGGTDTTLDAAIAVDTWFYAELYMKVAASGNCTLWINDVAKGEVTGDFSYHNSVEQIDAILHFPPGSSQATEVSFLHDLVRIDDTRIGGGTPKIFQANFMTLAVTTETESGTNVNPLENTEINGTRLTDSSGKFEWSNLDYDTEYEFHIEPPSGYYPGWIINYNGYFSWNGSAFVLFHTITEAQTGYIKIYFHEDWLPYVSEVPSATTLVSVNIEKATIFGDKFKFGVNGSSWIAIHSAGYNEDPFLCAGSTATAKTYNSTTKVCNITVASSTTIVLLYDRPTPSHWGIWFAGSIASGVAALLLGLWNRTKEIIRKWKWPIILFLVTGATTGAVLWLIE